MSGAVGGLRGTSASVKTGLVQERPEDFSVHLFEQGLTRRGKREKGEGAKSAMNHIFTFTMRRGKGGGG